jgi:vacuolar-type H+-ATPase subunit H
MQADTFWEFKMSTTEKYVHSLKQIKEAENNAQKEIDEQRKRVSEEFRNFESYVTKTVATARTDGEKLVESSVEQSRKKSRAEAGKIVEEANTKSKTISARIDAQTVREIIDIMLKEV